MTPSITAISQSDAFFARRYRVLSPSVKKRIQVSGSCTDHTAVEHRIYVIRAAFKRSHLKATVHQRLKQPAGDQGFPLPLAPAARSILGSSPKSPPSSVAGNDIDRILTHHHMIPSDRFGSCRRQLYDIHIR